MYPVKDSAQEALRTVEHKKQLAFVGWLENNFGDVQTRIYSNGEVRMWVPHTEVSANAELEITDSEVPRYWTVEDINYNGHGVMFTFIQEL